MTSDEFWAFNGIFHWTGVNKLNVEWFENHLNTLFLWYWVAYQHIIVDKGIIPFLGVMSGRAYIPKKPHDTGIKYYASADEMFYVLYFWLHGDFRTKAQKENNEPNPCSQNPNTVIWCVLNAVRDADEDAIKQRAETATREIVLEIAEEIEEEIGDAMVDEEPMTILMEDTVTEGIKEMGGYMVDNRILWQTHIMDLWNLHENLMLRDGYLYWHARPTDQHGSSVLSLRRDQHCRSVSRKESGRG